MEQLHKPGPGFPVYGDPHVKDKTVARPSYIEAAPGFYGFMESILH